MILPNASLVLGVLPGEAQPEPTHELLEGLTPSQAQAVVATEGPVLVLAGPGSGKTRVITRRIAYLLSLGVPGWHILAVTFTNKAAGEMDHRVRAVLGERADTAGRGLTITTFHSLCVRLLRRYAEMSGLPAAGVMKVPFTVFDDDDQQKVIKKVLGDLQLSTSNFPPRSVLSAISQAKNELVDAEQFAAAASDFQTRNIARVYKAYQKALVAAGGVDFDDLLLLTARMLRDSAQVRALVQERFRYLLIDEYQDTNRAQFLIASLIAGGGGEGRRPNICVVGDPDQSIYGWRGADLRNILQFEEQYAGCKVIRLGENFRSRSSILEAADRLIKHNTRRKAKTLTGTRGPGQAVEAVMCRDEHHEARLAIDWLRARMGESPSLAFKDAAIFYRTNALSRVVEDECRRQGLPYVMVRGTAFYQREEVKNALAYLRVIANPEDAVSLERIINTPARGISDATWERVQAEAGQREGGSAMRVLREVAQGLELAGVSTRAMQSIAKFLATLDAWRGAAMSTAAGAGPSGAGEGEGLLPGQVPPLADLVGRVVRESGLEKFYEKEEERVENLAELVSSAQEFAAAQAGGAGEDDLAPRDERGAATMEPIVEDGVVESASGGGEGAEGGEEEEPDPFGLYADAPETGRDGRGAAAPGSASSADAVNAPDAAGEASLAPVARSVLGQLRAYLERVALVADTDAIDGAKGAVTLMTLHAAKGLEYPLVAMIGLEEGMLPHVRSAESDEALEEERRLMFVGITRAMERLLITCAKVRTVRGLSERTIPSRFLDELRGDHVTFSDQSDPFGGADDDDEMRGFIARGQGGGRSDGDAAARYAARAGSGGVGRGGGASGGEGEWSPGTPVRHPQFGLGTVQQFWGGQGARVQVKFQQAGVKTLMLEYARLTRLG